MSSPVGGCWQASARPSWLPWDSSATESSKPQRTGVWDGKDQTLTRLLPLGLYHYRVVVTDAAGNHAHSGQSPTIAFVSVL